MDKGKFALTYLILLIAQVCVSNYLHISWCLYLTILPVMTFLVPTRFGTVSGMLIAFASGLAVDFFSDGLIGLNVLALVPVAMMRRGLITLLFGEDIFLRKEEITFSRHGWIRMFFAIALVQAVFLAIYIAADGAGTRPVGFNVARFGVSLVVGTLFSVFVALILEPDNTSR